MAPVGLAGLSSEAQAQAARPNIIYIVADDMGWTDAGFNRDRISRRLISTGWPRTAPDLEQFYAQPMCTPTRAALMTGRYPLRYGLQTGVIPGAGTHGLPTDEYLLPQMLKDSGYATALVGSSISVTPIRNIGPGSADLDYFYGALVGEIDHFKHSSHGVPDWYRDNTPIEEEGFDNTPLRRRKHSKVIEGHDRGRPLFLYPGVYGASYAVSRRRRTISTASSISKTQIDGPMRR